MPVLSVEISEEIYERLEQYLRAQGISPEAFTAVLLKAALCQLEADGLGRLAGVIESAPEDLSLRHDDYIGRSIQEEYRP
ncbi:MAG: hypothetical protein ABDI19_00490 [Armatimonadota bacterium]